MEVARPVLWHLGRGLSGRAKAGASNGNVILDVAHISRLYDVPLTPELGNPLDQSPVLCWTLVNCGEICPAYNRASKRSIEGKACQGWGCGWDRGAGAPP